MTKSKIEFPYLNLFYTNEEKIKIFRNLCKINLEEKVLEKNNFFLKYENIKLPFHKFLSSDGKFHFLQYKNDFYLDYGLLSSTFLDKCKVICKFSTFDSPLDYYTKNFSLERFKNKKGIELREEIYFSQKFECSNHNPAIIKFFINLYKAKRILDPSSGWGDRLLGALSCDIDLYISTDPNPCLHKYYKEMLKVLKAESPNPKAEFITLKSGFEKVRLSGKIDKESIDLIYTSPPYFDYEIYTDDKGQSIIGKTEELWFTSFIIPFIEKCYTYLKKDGHMVLYFSQEKGSTYIEKMFSYIENEKKFKYDGCYWYSSEQLKGLHPIFIFVKV